MAKCPKYHFLTVVNRSGGGTSIVAMPRQTFGRKAVPEHILVKNIGKDTSVARARKKASPGDVFFTTTLTDGGSCLKVRDIYPLDECERNVLLSDAKGAFEQYLQSLSN